MDDSIEDFEFKSEPFYHQATDFLRFRDLDYLALFWEMGLGKTKELIDIAAWKFLRKKIEALLIVAQRSVYPNWLSQEIPPHMAVPYAGFTYKTGESNRGVGAYKEDLILDPDRWAGCIRIVAMSYDQICLARGYEFAEKLCKMYDTMMVVDESTAIANGRTRRAKKIKEIGAHAECRAIATGTPVAEGPFKIHSQIEFLDPEFWAMYGMRTYESFKAQFGKRELRKIPGRRDEKMAYFNVGFRNMDKLNKMIQPFSSRLLKEDSSVKLPPKMYTLRTFELTEAQREAYDSLRREYVAELDGGLFVEAAMAIVRMMRLQQIASGFVTAEKYTSWDEEISTSEREVIDIVPFEENPRLLLLQELVEECSHKVIVWCRFKRDVDNVCRLFGESCVRFDGTTGQKQREEALRRFRDPGDSARVFVANTHAISHGVTLVIAKSMFYYSNSPSLERRLQSEDRIHRIGQDVSVNIVDICAEQTVDLKLYEGLKRKFNLAAEIMGDRFREWLT